MNLLKKPVLLIAFVLSIAICGVAFAFGAGLSSDKLVTVMPQVNNDETEMVAQADTKSITITVNWSDDSNAKKMRPSQVKFDVVYIDMSKLDANGAPSTTREVVTLSNKDNSSGTTWSKTISKTGISSDAIVSVTQHTPIQNYTPGDMQVDTTGNAFTVTNTLPPDASFELSGGVMWMDQEDFYGIRPASIGVELWRDTGDSSSATKVATKTVDAKSTSKYSDSWGYTFKGADILAANGDTVYHYFVKASATPSKYKTPTAIDDMFLQCEMDADLIKSVSIAVDWQDDNNRDNKRPSLSTLTADKLFDVFKVSGGSKTNITTINSTIDLSKVTPKQLDDNTWLYSIILPSTGFNDANINYAVDMKNLEYYTPDKASAPHAKDEDETSLPDAFVTTLTHVPEKVEISGVVTWNDTNNAINARPTDGIVTLFKEAGGNRTQVSSIDISADGNASTTNENKWEWSFPKQYAYENGKKVTYSTEVFFHNLDSNYRVDTNGNNVTCSYPVINKDFILVFDDANDADNMRQGFQNNVTIQLYKKSEGEQPETPITGVKYTKNVALEQGKSQYTVSFAGIPKEDSDGNTIEYVARPVFLNNTPPEGYIASCDDKTNTITLTHKSTSITYLGKVRWEDNNNENSLRLKEVTLGLYRTGDDIETPELVKTAKAVPPAAGAATTNEWDYRFEPVQAVDDDGKAIAYVVDVVVPDEGLGSYLYTKDGDDFVFTYSDNLNESDKDVSINWNDDDNDNGDRPESVVVKLYANDVAIDDAEATLQSNDDPDLAWKHVFENLPVYDDEQNRIDYTLQVTAIEPAASADRYELNVQDDGYGNTFIINAVYSPELADISGSIAWDDNNDNDKARPQSVIVRLFNSEELVASQTLNANDENQWDFTFADVAVKLHGKDPGYYVEVTDMPDTYEVTIDGLNVSAKYDPQSTSRQVNVEWNGGTSRPAVNVMLTANGENRGTIKKLIGPDWSYKWTGLPLLDNGVTIAYGVTVTDVPGYVTNVTTDSSGNFNVTCTANSVTFQNVDANTGAGISNSKYQLLDKTSNAVLVEWTSDGAPHKVEEVIAGKTYVLHEVSPGTGYSAASDQNIVIGSDGRIDASASNVHVENGVVIIASTTSTGKLMGNIQWTLPTGFDSLHKPFVTVELYCNNVTTGKTVRTQDGNYAFLGLSQYDGNGTPLTYNVRARIEAPTAAAPTWTAADWTCSTMGNDIVVKYEPEMTSVRGSIVWVGDTSADRPSSVTVNVMLNGQKAGQQAVLAADFWLYEIGDLPVRATDGTTNKITVSQNAINGYATSAKDYVITNVKTGGGSAVQQQLIANGIYYIESSMNANKVLDISGGSIGDGANAQLWTKNNSNAQKFRVTYTASSNTYTLTCVNSNKMLDVRSAHYVNGTNIHQWVANGSNAQKWKIVMNTDGTYRIQAAGNANYVLDVNAGSTKDGANVQIWSYNGSKAQAWRFTKTTETPAPSAKTIANGTYTLYSKVGTNKVLDISGASKNSGANAQIWTANGTNAQKFTFTYDSNGYYTIKNVASGKMLDAKAGATANGTNVQQYASNGTDAQKWRVTKNSDGTYTIVNKKSGKVLDVNAAANKDGANVHLWASNGTNAQKWRIS